MKKRYIRFFLLRAYRKWVVQKLFQQYFNKVKVVDKKGRNLTVHCQSPLAMNVSTRDPDFNNEANQAVFASHFMHAYLYQRYNAGVGTPGASGDGRYWFFVSDIFMRVVEK